MSLRRHLSAVLCCGVFLLAGCSLPGRPDVAKEPPARPELVTSFDVLYGDHCAGCHGADGQNGPATNLANPVYQALIDDGSLRDVIANGEKGTLMPAFARARGGDLTPNQIDALVQGIRSHWRKGDVLAGADAPPYRATHDGDAARGQGVYATACARCHGAVGQKPGAAGSILDGSFLSLVNEQMIRTTIIAGRPDVGQPDWRGLVPGRALTDAEITDVTTWMMAQRPASPGQPYPDAQPTSEKPGEAQPLNVQKPGAPAPAKNR